MDLRSYQPSMLRLHWLDDEFAICKLDNRELLPPWCKSPFLSATWTNDELSIVARCEDVPKTITQNRGWRAFRIAGQIDFAVTGIAAGITGTLAAAGVPVFVISTFDTDYVLVPSRDTDRASESLTEAGYCFEQSSGSA